MHADLKFRIDIRGPKTSFAWRCACQTEPTPDGHPIKTEDILAWVNHLLVTHLPHAKQAPEVPPAPATPPPPPGELIA